VPKKNQLALSLRPRRFSDLIGQEKVVRKIRNLVKKRKPKGFLFHGPKGVGKTTIARILSVAFQCRHSKEFGDPCDKCQRRYRHGQFSITEINCASLVDDAKKRNVTAAQALREVLGGSSYELPAELGRCRVFILDEAHDLSASAQDVALKPLEDSPFENVFILNSTRPEKIVDTLRSRCMTIHIRPLNPDGIKSLVKRGLKECHSKLNSENLVDALVEIRQTSPRMILNAVENYVAGDTPEEAADVEAATDVNAKALIRHVIKGDWSGVAKMLKEAPPTEARRLRAATVGYLREMLFDCSEVDDRTKAVYVAIKTLTSTSWTEDANQIALLGADLASCCRTFQKYPF
jgi:DNA polymerase III subunit gamma/tau